MARPVRGAEVLEMAQEMILRAKTIDELRQAQAVVLPLAHGLSLAETARAIGRSVVWTCRLRNRFLAGETVGDGQRQRPGGRRRENLSVEREREVLAPFLERARNGGILVVPQIKGELEASLGREMALSSVYNLLHRHGWRKLAPDKRHPQSDPVAQEAWKKTPRNADQHHRRLAGTATGQADVPGRGARFWENEDGSTLCAAAGRRSQSVLFAAPCSRTNTPMPMARSMWSAGSSIP